VNSVNLVKVRDSALLAQTVVKQNGSGMHLKKQASRRFALRANQRGLNELTGRYGVRIRPVQNNQKLGSRTLFRPDSRHISRD
jgi:hypothetical protein